MSAKNRSTTSIPGDQYPTPPWAVHRLLEAAEPGDLDGYWLEPAYGEGVLQRAVSRFYGSKRDRISWAMLDINPYAHAPGEILVCDFLTWQAPRIYDVSITNPPFSLAFEFARKMTEVSKHAFLLTRLNILEAGKRSGRLAWLREHMPDVYVLPDRPCFSHTLRCTAKKISGRYVCKGVPIAWDASTPPIIECGCGDRPLSYDPPLWHVQQHGVALRTAGTDATGYCWLHFDVSKMPRSTGRIVHLAETPSSGRVDRIIP